MSETPLNILSGQLNELSGRLIDIDRFTNTLRAVDSESKEANEILNGLLEKMRVSVNLLREAQKDVIVTQTTLNGRLREVRESFLRLVGTREPDLKIREESVAEFDQQSTAVNKLIADRANAIATAPSPFDDNARRARATSIAKEQGKFDTAAEKYDTRTRYYSGRIESVNKQIRRIKLGYAHKLLERHKEDNRLIVGWRESSDDYPNKYDYRQSDLLNAFADKFKLDKASDEDYRDYHRRISDTFDSPFFKENKLMMDLLRDPKAERDQYDAIKIHYDTFIEGLDNRYKTIDSTMRNRLGNISDVSRRTAESLSAPSYLRELDNYINNEATADENKALAIKCKSEKSIGLVSCLSLE